ncbi:MAG: hypothetical protein ABJ139_20070 [Paracoccaceae bacterium]
MDKTCNGLTKLDADYTDDIQSDFAITSELNTFFKKRPLVCVIAYDGLCTFEFGIAVELFALPRPESTTQYDFTTVQAKAGPIRAAGGITIQAQADISLLENASLIIVPGWRGADAPVLDNLCVWLCVLVQAGVPST